MALFFYSVLCKSFTSTVLYCTVQLVVKIPLILAFITLTACMCVSVCGKSYTLEHYMWKRENDTDRIKENHNLKFSSHSDVYTQPHSAGSGWDLGWWGAVCFWRLRWRGDQQCIPIKLSKDTRMRTHTHTHTLLFSCHCTTVKTKRWTLNE